MEFESVKNVYQWNSRKNFHVRKFKELEFPVQPSSTEGVKGNRSILCLVEFSRNILESPWNSEMFQETFFLEQNESQKGYLQKFH